MRIGRGAAVVLGGLVVAAQLTACTTGDTSDGAHEASRTSAAPASEHRDELARDGQALQQVFQVPSDAVGVSYSQIATGIDTPEGWQVQGFTAVTGFDVARAGTHYVHVACAGTGKLTVTARRAEGTAAAPSPASTTTGPTTSLDLDCTSGGVSQTADFSLVEGDPGVEVVVVPAVGTVAMAGYAIS